MCKVRKFRLHKGKGKKDKNGRRQERRERRKIKEGGN